MVPTAVFSWYTTYSSSDGKSLSLNYTQQNPNYSSYSTSIEYLYTPAGVRIGQIENLSKTGTDFLSRPFSCNIITKYGFMGGSIKPINQLILNSFKVNSGFSLNKKIYGIYYYDTNGILKGYSESGNLTGTLNTGERYSGTINTFASFMYGSIIRPSQVTKINFYKGNLLFAKTTFTNYCSYKLISGCILPSFERLVTYTVFNTGASRNSIINTTNTYNSTISLTGTKIIGNATGYDVVYGKKVYYKSKIQIQKTKTSTTKTKVLYKETKLSKSPKLNRIIPYEAIFYEDLKQ